MKQLVLGLLSITLLVSACKKSKDAPAITKENIAGTYKQTAQVTKTQGQADVDDFASFPSCEKDDLLNFNLDGTYVVDDAGTVCNPSDNAQSTWQLSGTTMTITEVPFAVTKFDGSILELTYSSSSGGVPYSTIVTLKKQ